MSNHLERRLAVQLADKTKDELIAMLARQQIRHEREDQERRNEIGRRDDAINGDPPGSREIELVERIGRAYFGPEDMRGLTLPMMARNMESDATALGYPVREYLKRFTNSGRRRRES